ncbi:chromosome partitioning protein, ParB family [Pseudorhodobacter antarcticus]|uniref:Chromosome partitioning protein, ParB family n=1 Tax=Pseudorhodobacter antarcticus TaxID=1077947 RepID=A0A1H8MYS5_9RHOB|nr:chromosome partitioning protein, ParB family [Pseudorhodobacter antarcticus]
MDALEVAMETLEQRPLIYEAEDVARAGVFVTLDRYGVLALHRGFVRPEDEASMAGDGEQAGADATGQGADAGSSSYHQEDGATVGTIITSGSPSLDALAEEDDDGVLKPLPERLVTELTSHRTLALREALGRSPDVALTLLLVKRIRPV